MLVLKPKEKIMEHVCGGFSNDVSARPATLLKAVTTTDILLDKFHKSQNSYFKEHLKIILLKSVPWNMVIVRGPTEIWYYYQIWSQIWYDSAF